MATPQKQLEGFLAKYDPAVVKQAKAVLAAMRKRLPGATEIVYDNYNALACGFGPGEKTSHAILSIAVYPKWVTLFFLHGAKLPDPTKRLAGAGKQVRSIRLDDGVATLRDPAVDALIDAALESAPVAIDPGQRYRLIIKSVSPTQRPRRPAPTAAPAGRATRTPGRPAGSRSRSRPR